ncbi:MAG: tRNA lysidine(34) synthetase TilS [Candidatus Solibacter usitatus]|nr:tRNA lysidine(34) synthetase TilS [Candidatus Solibacter usitatus]
MLDRIVETTLRYSMFARGDRVGVAVSGGADSLCLLHALYELRARWELQLTVLHVDHGLREDSGADAHFVEGVARSLRINFLLHRVDSMESPNLEQAARNARLNFFHALIRDGSLDKVATGHTASDQAETVLMRFLRGSGTAGLAGILPVTKEGIVRPLLGIERSDAETFLSTKGLVWRTDSTNDSREFDRNRVRLDLLPMLEREFNPAIVSGLNQVAALAREEEEYWTDYIAKLAADSLEARGPAILLDCRKLAGHTTAVRRRLIREAIRRVKGDLRQVDFRHVERILEMAGGAEGHGRALIPGVDVCRSFDWVRFAPPGLDAGVDRLANRPLTFPGESCLDAWSRAVAITPTPDAGYNDGCNVIDIEKLAGPLILRYWLPGDAYCPAGRERPEKIKQMFQDARIPLWERRFWPIIESASSIVWSRRFGVSRDCAPQAGSRKLGVVSES